MELLTVLRTAAISSALFLASCVPEKFDHPICHAPPKIGSDTEIQKFASGYFPPEYGDPSSGCNYRAGPTAIIGEVEREWYPRQWAAASEPSLYEAAQCNALPDFVLRFSYIPSFDPSVFIRVQSDGDGLKLTASEMTGAGGYDPGEVGRTKEVRLSEKQAFELREMLDAQALFEEKPDICQAGLDGSSWIFELVDKDGYRMVKRWSPEDGAAHNLGILLIEFTDWSFEPY